MSQQAYLVARFSKDATVISFPEGGRGPHEQRKAAKRAANLAAAKARTSAQAEADRVKYIQAAGSQQQPTVRHIEAPAATRRLFDAGDRIDQILNSPPPPAGVTHHRTKSPKKPTGMRPKDKRYLIGAGAAAGIGATAIGVANARRQRQYRQQHLRRRLEG